MQGDGDPGRALGGVVPGREVGERIRAERLLVSLVAQPTAEQAHLGAATNGY